MKRPPNSSNVKQDQKENTGFTLVELITSMAIFSAILLLLTSMMGTIINTWSTSESKVETVQNARGALELITREMTPAVIDTHMQFVIMPGKVLAEEVSVPNIVEQAQVALWMAPLGSDGGLRCVGYYLARDEEKDLYQLKRIFVGPDNTSGYPLMHRKDRAKLLERVSPTEGDFFYKRWNTSLFDEEGENFARIISSTASDYVVAFWIQAVDVLGNEIPWLSNSEVHPQSDLHYNSSSYFHVATSRPFDDGKSFVYLAETEQVMKGNRVPASVDITLVTIDQVSIDRELTPPEQINILDDDGFLDVEESVRQYKELLDEAGLKNARSFSTRVKLMNGS